MAKEITEEAMLVQEQTAKETKAIKEEGKKQIEEAETLAKIAVDEEALKAEQVKKEASDTVAKAAVEAKGAVDEAEKVAGDNDQEAQAAIKEANDLKQKVAEAKKVAQVKVEQNRAETTIDAVKKVEEARAKAKASADEIEGIKKQTTKEKAAAEAEAKKMEERSKDEATKVVKQAADEAAKEAKEEAEKVVQDELAKMAEGSTGLGDEYNNAIDPVNNLVIGVKSFLTEVEESTKKLANAEPLEEVVKKPELPSPLSGLGVSVPDALEPVAKLHMRRKAQAEQ